MRISISQARNQLAQLVERALKGEQISLCKAGKPCVDLIPHQKHKHQRQPGRYKGQITIYEDFERVNTDFPGDDETPASDQR